MSSAFDPNSFLDSQTTEASVKRPAIPAMTELVAVVKDLKAQSGPQKGDPTKTYTAINMILEIDLTQNPGVQALLGLDSVMMYDIIFLDINEGDQLDMAPGRNNKLRKYREACNLNQPGQPFSPRMFMGRMIKVQIGNDVKEGEVVDYIKGVVRAA